MHTSGYLYPKRTDARVAAELMAGGFGIGFVLGMPPAPTIGLVEC